MKNIEYKSEQISEFYRTNRMQYSDFYLSEKYIIESVFKEDSKKSVLDIGCACGGLGKALSEKFNISKYTGVDINKAAIEWANQNNKLNIPYEYIAGDILNETVTQADVVFSLSCADWNIETDSIIQKSWEQVNMGGVLILSLRLTNKQSINDINKSYQYIDFFKENDKKEKANYVIFNINDTFKMFNDLSPKASNINAYGYYGLPSQSANVPYDKLLFAVFSIKKDMSNACNINLNFPLDIFL